MGQINLTELTKVYGSDVRAVDGIDLDVEDGEFFSLLGPSGCGKTTTLRMISGFETPTEGDVHIAGMNVTSDPPESRPTNMVFQNLALFSHMNVYENIAYGLKRSGTDESEIETEVEEALELVDMDGYGDRQVTELSGGQQQRIALARAVVNRVDVLLLDEPLASLDRKLRQQMQRELRKIHDEIGMTFFYVTHDQQAAMTMSDRMAIMNEGHIEQVGRPSEVYDDPASPFVADFIGDMNAFEGRLDGGVFVTEEGDAFTPPEAAGGDPSKLVVRPEKFLIGDDLDLPNTIRGTVTETVFRGPTIQYEIASEGRTLSVESQNVTRNPPYQVGNEVVVGWNPEVGILYD